MRCSGDELYAVGMELLKALPDCRMHSVSPDLSGGVCICETAVYGQKIRTDVAAHPSGIPQQHGGCGLLHFNLPIRSRRQQHCSYFCIGGRKCISYLAFEILYDGIPVELDEAAMMDGANRFQVFYKVILPLAMPQLAVLFLFSFIATYSEYVITSIFLQTPGKMTLALGLQSFISDQFAAHWTMFSAAAVISSLPVMVVFMCLQRFIQNGLAAGGVKG